MYVQVYMQAAQMHVICAVQVAVLFGLNPKYTKIFILGLMRVFKI